jgi:PhzF family phenazine biosynthesis protein
MPQRYFVVNAFTRDAFGGNPAGVCPLAAWLPDDLMQRIATENGLSETAFFVAVDDHFELRWFTPAAEVALCGHATLASAHVLFKHLQASGDSLEFRTRSGPLFVSRDGTGDRYVLDLPAQPGQVIPAPSGLAAALGAVPLELYATDDLMVLLESAGQVKALTPDFTALAKLDARGVIVTAPGEDCDFVSRFFAPAVGIDEDPVTGSAHCKLTPFWAARLGRDELHARQVSARGGELFCSLHGDRVQLAGHAVDYLRGEIEIPESS